MIHNLAYLSGEILIVLMIVGDEIRFCKPVQQKILQQEIQKSLVFPSFHKCFGQLPSDHIIIETSIPGKSEGVEGFNTVGTFVLLQHIVDDGTQCDVHPLDFQFDDKRYFSVNHFQKFLKSGNLLLGIQQTELLQFLQGVVAHFSFHTTHSF